MPSSQYQATVRVDGSEVSIALNDNDMELAQVTLQGPLSLRNINSVVEQMMEAFLSGTDVNNFNNPLAFRLETQVLNFTIEPIWEEFESPLVDENYWDRLDVTTEAFNDLKEE